MPLFTIDTLQFSKRMQKAGLQKEVAEVIKDASLQSQEGIATKQDIKILEQNTKQEMRILEHKLTVRIFIMLAAAVGAITWLDRVIG